MKCQNLMSIYMIEHALGIDWLIELLGTQGAQEVLFQLLCIVNSRYFKLLAILLYSKHYPSAGSVGECTYGFPYILREFALGLLSLEVLLFDVVDSVYQLFLCHNNDD